jgi:hypothetical protein
MLTPVLLCQSSALVSIIRIDFSKMKALLEPRLELFLILLTPSGMRFGGVKVGASFTQAISGRRSTVRGAFLGPSRAPLVQPDARD